MADEHGGGLKLPWGSSARRILRRGPSAGPVDWRDVLRSRLVVYAGLFVLWTVSIEARLVYLQVIEHGDMMARANRQQLRTVKLPAKRGEIVDRAGRVLAYSVDADTIAADPTEVDDPETVATRVCAALDHCSSPQREVMAERLRSKQQFVYLARQVSADEARRIKALDLPGVAFYKESRRYYPKKELAAHVLGYVGLDNVGLAGLESTFDARIRGREGKMLLQRDARRRAMSSREERLPTAGDGLELTLDEYLQFIADRELRRGVAENAASGGTAIILQPSSGEILALANWPTFNPNAFNASDVVARRNRAVQDLYEPGSTFKIVTASAAIEEGLIRTTDQIDCSPGHITFGSRVIRDTHEYGVLPFIDVIARSSNVGAIKVGMKVGSNRLSQYVSRFGFGQTLASDFRGENAGMVYSAERLDASALASVSMGYQVGVTPLQMAMAVAAVANGGELIEPHVVRAFIRNGHREEVPRNVVRRAIAPETAATVTEIMEAVVERGTAKSFAQIDGYTVAGKTGTASKIVNAHYSKSDYNASFIGFVPSRKPAIAIVVVIDSPHAGSYYGAVVSAPVFKRIAEATLRHLGIGPTLNAPSPVIVARHDTGASDMTPVPVMATSSQNVVASTPPGVMPDLHGLSARDAIRALMQIGLTPRLDGDGFVIDQSPRAGAVLGGGDSCVLKLDRRAPPAPGGAVQ
ncbi:MAG TPA: penicillin-binding transpeptidase domain-containing protein [Vicinamibacterales bacterium]|nr:penicillin-binding transpeptidase domain-containing protein [Vicinamibacterales bacterium]